MNQDPAQLALDKIHTAALALDSAQRMLAITVQEALPVLANEIQDLRTKLAQVQPKAE